MAKKKGRQDINELKKEVLMDEHEVQLFELMMRYESSIGHVCFIYTFFVYYFNLFRV